MERQLKTNIFISHKELSVDIKQEAVTDVKEVRSDKIT